ncbi:MAG: SOS response-associated peptidase [Candidatus Omnitrophica bacterium]|nr:SOS response-associated peptidase [Candidatus Omnitrophota bacterium]
MCGRFGLTKDEDYLMKRFGVQKIVPDYRVSFNIKPSEKIAVILNTEPQKIRMVHWGYTPHWMKKESALEVINIREEGMDSKYFYKDSFYNRRCLILADMFYEWDKMKQAYKFFKKGEEAFAFPGLWDVFEGRIGCAIITAEANKLIKPVHARMPVILDDTEEKAWLEKPKKKFKRLKDDMLDQSKVNEKIH